MESWSGVKLADERSHHQIQNITLLILSPIRITEQ